MIELGGLVVKAGLVESTDDKRATLYGVFLAVVDKLRGEDRERALMLRKRKGIGPEMPPVLLWGQATRRLSPFAAVRLSLPP